MAAQSPASFTVGADLAANRFPTNVLFAGKPAPTMGCAHLTKDGKDANLSWKNLRTGRCLETNQPYLITTVTLDRRPLFDDWYIGRMLVTELKNATEKNYAETLAWVVMPDHLHWLMIPGAEALDAVIRRIKSRSAIAANRHMGTNGPVWQHGYYDHALRKTEDIRTVARYLIANPLRAGLVKHIGDYPLWDTRWLL
jgi:putative transposase